MAEVTISQLPANACQAIARRGQRARAAMTLLWPAGLLAAPALAAWDALPLCGFRYLTGAPCPLCGGTRACAALVQGEFMAAWQFNPGVVMLLAVGTAQVGLMAIKALMQRPHLNGHWDRILASAWGCAATAVLLVWAQRLLDHAQAAS